MNEKEQIDLETFLPELKSALHGLNLHLATVARYGSSNLLADVVRIMGGVANEMCVQWKDYHHGGRGGLN